MNKLDKTYTDLLQDILDNGVTKSDRTGTGTISIFGRQIRHKMSDGFPLITTKKMAFKTMVTELLWFLRGDTNIKFLVDNNCHIWDGDAYKNYLHKVIRDKDIVQYLKSYSKDTKGVPTIELYSKDEFIERIKNVDEFAKKWGDLGPVYGKQWRSWCGYEKVPSGWNHGAITHYKEVPKCDQIANLINDLKTNPDSRRLMVTAWNPAEIDKMTLPPCHYGFQVYTRELSLDERHQIHTDNVSKLNGRPMYVIYDGPESERENFYDEENIPKRAISLMWNQRSCDVPLGIPMNISSYGLLLMMIADEVNMIPEDLIGNLGDCHIYLNQMDGVKEQIGREPFELPTVYVRDGIHCSSVNDVILENYQSHPKIYFPLSN